MAAHRHTVRPADVPGGGWVEVTYYRDDGSVLAVSVRRGKGPSLHEARCERARLMREAGRAVEASHG